MKANVLHVSFGHRSNLSAAWTLASAQRTENSAVNFAFRIRAPRNSIAEPSVALVTGGAVLGFDDQVHIDLDRAAHGAFARRSEAIRSRAQMNRRCDRSLVVPEAQKRKDRPARPQDFRHADGVPYAGGNR